MLTLTDHITARDEAWRAQHAAPGEPYLVDVLGDYATRYAAHLARMTIEPDMIAWAMQMSIRFGPCVKVFHFVHDSWLTALLVIRYGEEPDPARTTDPTFLGWPLAFSADDRVRALELLNAKRIPDSVTLLPREVPS